MAQVWIDRHDLGVDQEVGIIAWIVVGLIGGYLANRVVNKSGEGLVRDIILGIAGEIVGGIVFRAFGARGVTGLNIWSILVAFLGRVVVLVLYPQFAGSLKSLACERSQSADFIAAELTRAQRIKARRSAAVRRAEECIAR
jgi:uncharacterized membrane protein YeaQ/YmgE (transglycosylase-associated protein family)